MSKETYPARVPVFERDSPTTQGYYWWKETTYSDPEIVFLKIEDKNKALFRCNGKSALKDGTNGMGLFSDKIPSIWEVI